MIVKYFSALVLFIAGSAVQAQDLSKEDLSKSIETSIQEPPRAVIHRPPPLPHRRHRPHRPLHPHLGSSTSSEHHIPLAASGFGAPRPAYPHDTRPAGPRRPRRRHHHYAPPGAALMMQPQRGPGYARYGAWGFNDGYGSTWGFGAHRREPGGNTAIYFNHCGPGGCDAREVKKAKLA